MKTRLFIMLLWCSMCIQSATAQNTVESIKTRYSSMKNYIAKMTGENQYDGATWPIYYHVEAYQYLPGTGGHKNDIYLYYDEREEDKIYCSHYLSFATTKYNYAARVFYEEYLYDSDGKVAFIYASAPMTEIGSKTVDSEFRFYFSRGKLINSIIKERGEGQTDFKQVYSGSKPNAEYQEYISIYLNNAQKHLKLFDDIDRATYEYDE